MSSLNNVEPPRRQKSMQQKNMKPKKSSALSPAARRPSVKAVPSGKRSALFWSPFWALFVKEMLRVKKVALQTVVTPVVTSGLYLLIFGVGVGRKIQLASGVSYLEFIIPGLVMMGVLNNAFQNASTCVINGKFTGELEDYKAAPLSSEQMLWALGLGGLVRGLIVGLVTWGVGQVFVYSNTGSWLQVQHVFGFFFFAVLGGLSFAFLGMAVAFWARNFDHIAAVGGFILQPLIYLGGVFFSLDVLSPFWQGVSKLNPLFYILNGARFSIIGETDVSLTSSVVMALLGVLLMYVVGMSSIRWGSFSRW